MTYTIRPALVTDLPRMARNLRAEDRCEITDLGLAPRRALHMLFRESLFVRAAEVDGELAALWGLLGAMASDEANPWLFTAPPIERVPLAFFREASREVARMLATRRRLSVHVAAGYERSVRFWQMIGFRAGDPFAAPTGAPFRELVMERD